jgi:hypothetical protein
MNLQSVLDARRVFLAQVNFFPKCSFTSSKGSEKDNPHNFYPNNFNHAVLPKPDFEGYSNNAKKEFEENQNYVGDEKFHQEQEYPIPL